MNYGELAAQVETATNKIPKGKKLGIVVKLIQNTKLSSSEYVAIREDTFRARGEINQLICDAFNYLNK